MFERWLRPATLSDQLTRTLVLWVGTVWLACVVGVVWYADVEIDRNFDNELVEVSHRMFDIALDKLDKSPRPTHGPIIVPPPETFHDAAVLYQIVDEKAFVLVRSAETPADTFTNVPARAGFYDTPSWRIYTVKHPDRGLYLQVADPLDERSEAVNHTLFGLMVPLFAVLPLLAILLRSISRKELRVLEKLAEEIGKRDGNQLNAITLTGLPQELQFTSDHVNRLLGRLSQALDVERALAANAAHELRTPLAAARLRLQTALDSPNANDSRENIAAALSSLQTLSQRAEKLLQLSRAESGGALGRSPVDLVQLAAAVAEEFWGMSGAEHRLQLEVGEAAAPIAMGDRDALAIALRNLVENALRYSGDGMVEIEVMQPATLVVRDHGIGVKPELLNTLTERHVRHTKESAGYGLGLSIVGTIVQKHDARLELVSPVPGRTAGQAPGLEARIVLPPYRPAPG